MPEIRLENITKRWGKFYAVENLDLFIENNAFVTLLGPSGCGKTTTLRMIAGLETPTSGKITIGDKVVFDSELGINVPANKRKVGFLFQNYALWPNMTVYQNIAFGLSNIKEEMPKINFEARKNAVLLKLLKNPADIVKILSECRDKKGKIDEKKALIKLIDAFTISQYTAKKLLGYHLEEGKSVDKEVQSLEIAVTNIKSKQNLNENFEVINNGQIVQEVRRMHKEEIDLAVRRVSRVVKISMFMDRYPAELSGGQQQRVAIARTLAPEPSVLFMDEPLSNLDAKLRLEMRYELQRLHVETGSTFVYVTHDQMEAMTLATKICLINNGVLQQYDAPLTVYSKPNNLFVADFVGNPSINFVEAKGTQEKNGDITLSIFKDRKAIFRATHDLDLEEWFKNRDEGETAKVRELKEKMNQKGYVEKGNKDETFRYHIAKVVETDDSMVEEPVLSNEDFVLGIRPEFISITEDKGVEGEIYGAMPTGMESTIKLRIDDFLLTAVVFGNRIFSIGTKAKFSIEGDDVLLFDRKTGNFIAMGSLELF